jgi:hypothetical protein
MKLSQFVKHLIFPNKPWLFKKQIHDDIFGMMWFNKDKRQPQYDHYQGHFLFKPINKEIDIYFDADPEGITNEQKVTFKSLESEYKNYTFRLLQPMQEKIKARKDVQIVIKDFNAEFQLFAISISRVKNGQKDISLNYASDTHGISNISATFSNGELVKIEC